MESQQSPVNPAELFQSSPDSRAEFFRISGQLTGPDNQLIVGATVMFVESGLTATTNAQGRYQLSPLLHSAGSPPSCSYPASTVGEHRARVQYYAAATQSE